jgi:hypothetical protein
VSNIVFDDEMGRIQREIAESHDLVVIPGYVVGRGAVSKEEGDASGRRISRPRSTRRVFLQPHPCADRSNSRLVRSAL